MKSETVRTILKAHIKQDEADGNQQGALSVLRALMAIDAAIRKEISEMTLDSISLYP